MTANDAFRRNYIDGLGKIPVLLFGDFILQSGAKSKYYFDLRRIQSSPPLLRDTAQILRELALQGPAFDRIAPVPTAATVFTSPMCAQFNLPMITPREAKGHGSGAVIEGIWEKGMTVCLIDDLITSALSKLKTIAILEAAGLVVKEVVILVERNSAGTKELESRGYKLRFAYTMDELLTRWKETGLLTDEQDKIIRFPTQAASPEAAKTATA